MSDSILTLFKVIQLKSSCCDQNVCGDEEAENGSERTKAIIIKIWIGSLK